FEETRSGLHARTPCAQRRHFVAAQRFSTKHRRGDMLGAVKIRYRNLHPIHAFQHHRNPLSAERPIPQRKVDVPNGGLTIFNEGCDEYSALDRARSPRGRISSSMMVQRIDTSQCSAISPRHVELGLERWFAISCRT